MSKYNPNVGDLICYNVAGMRKHSLGLVLDTYITEPCKRYIRIYWTLRPSTPPQAEWVSPVSPFAPDYSPDRDRIEGWYRDAGCFEVLG